MHSNLRIACGFTLIELSIVLVIVGLIVGGVLVGRDLISTASIRAQLTQIEKYQQAVNTFKVKYNNLPGDIPSADANQLGLQPRGIYAGQGDGNGIIEGVWTNAAASNTGWSMGAGETLMFWVDLSTARLIDNSFTSASSTIVVSGLIPTTGLNRYYPEAKIGQGNFIYVYSNALSGFGLRNLFGISALIDLTPLSNSCGMCLSSNPGLTTAQASIIDKKIDDGIPNRGNVVARYLDYVSAGSAGAIWASYASTSTSSSCFQNTTNQYSVDQPAGRLNCALSFKFQ